MKDFARLDEQFAELKAAWPPEAWRDEAKARRLFYQLEPGEKFFSDIMAALRIQAASVRWDDPKYIPSPKNWIAERKWTEKAIAFPPAGNPDRCPNCGYLYRVHNAYGNGRPNQRQAPDGSYCP